MAEHKTGLRTKAAMGVAALTLFLAQLACGGAPKIDPCDEAFLELQTMFESGRGAGNISENIIDINPSVQGISTHPIGWQNPIIYLDINCKDNYLVDYAGEGSERFTEGVVVKRKTAQNFSLPELSLNWVMAAGASIVAILGIGALGLGAKKLVAA